MDQVPVAYDLCERRCQSSHTTTHDRQRDVDVLPVHLLAGNGSHRGTAEWRHAHPLGSQSLG